MLEQFLNRIIRNGNGNSNGRPHFLPSQFELSVISNDGKTVTIPIPDNQLVNTTAAGRDDQMQAMREFRSKGLPVGVLRSAKGEVPFYLVQVFDPSSPYVRRRDSLMPQAVNGGGGRKTQWYPTKDDGGPFQMTVVYPPTEEFPHPSVQIWGPGWQARVEPRASDQPMSTPGVD